jgi:hypothetical protein
MPCNFEEYNPKGITASNQRKTTASCDAPTLEAE